MNAEQLDVEAEWVKVCDSADLKPNLGVRALVDKKQIAIFRVQGNLYAVSAIDPFTHAAVISRGLVGDLQGQIVVASPIYKQHFNLATGKCLEDDSVALPTYAVRELDDGVQVKL